MWMSGGKNPLEPRKKRNYTAWLLGFDPILSMHRIAGSKKSLIIPNSEFISFDVNSQGLMSTHRDWCQLTGIHIFLCFGLVALPFFGTWKSCNVMAFIACGKTAEMCWIFGSNALGWFKHLGFMSGILHIGYINVLNLICISRPCVYIHIYSCFLEKLHTYYILNIHITYIHTI